MYSYGPPHMAEQKQDDQHEHTFSNYVRIRDVVQKTCQRRWTIGRSGERGSGISMLPARHDDDDDLYWCVVVAFFYVSRYLSRVMWSNPGNAVTPSPTLRFSSYWKGSLLVTLDYCLQLYFYLILPNTIHLQTAKWFRVLLCNTKNSIQTHFKSCYLTLIILIQIQSFAYS